MSKNPQGRHFLALPLPKEVKKELKLHSWSSLEKYKDEKLTPVYNYHITLCYIGELDEEQEKNLEKALQSFEWGERFDLSLSEFGAFPSLEQGRVIWAGVNDQKNILHDLALRIRKHLDQHQIPYDQKPFVPHITLCRLRSPKNISKLKNAGKMKQLVRLDVDEIVHLQSFRDKHPYEERGHYPLKKIS